jgi:hypothetical protein
MKKHIDRVFDHVIALATVPAIQPGQKGIITGISYRSLAILWEGRTQPANYERPAIDAKVKRVKLDSVPANRVSKHKKVDAQPPV